MTTGWTGGQYSIYRGLLALGIAILLGSRIGTSPSLDAISISLGVGIVGCIALAIGEHDRWIALLLALLVALVVAPMDDAALVLPGADIVSGIILLALHAATPKAPFGSWEARGRPDPAGDWWMPSWIGKGAWIGMALFYLGTDLERISNSAFRPGWIDTNSLAMLGLLFDAAFLIAIVRVRWRAAAWIAMTLWKLAWLFAFGPIPGLSIIWLFHLLACDPAWLPGRPRMATTKAFARPARLFYDGECGLCHRTLRFILSEEKACPEEMRLRFSPIGSESYARMIENSGSIEADELPDSIVLELEEGQILTRSAAALEIANRLGGLWRAIAFIVPLGGFMPKSVLDAAYDKIARIRKRIFARPKESCPILPAHLRARFEL